MNADLADIEVVRRWRGVRALVIGDALLDDYIDGAALRLADDRPVPLVHKHAETFSPGGAANVASVLRCLGAEVVLIGIVGCDATAAQLRQSLNNNGVDDRWLVEDPEVSSLRMVRVRANDQYVLRLDEGNTQQPSRKAQRDLLSRVRETFNWADVTIVSDYLYGAVSNELIAMLDGLHNERPKVLAIDSKDPLRYCHCKPTVIAPNCLEASLALADGSSDLRRRTCHAANAEHVLRTLHSMIDADCVVITMGHDGVMIGTRDGTISRIPAPTIPGADPIGAGDTFIAVMALALTVDASARQSAQIAVAAAGVAVAKRGTAVPHLEDLIERLHAGRPYPPKTWQRLATILERDRAAGRKLVFTSGVFDILHAGHVNLLHQAKELGDVLIVGLNSDKSVGLLKGHGRPIVNERDRAALIASIRAVDHVTIFDEDSPAELIRFLRPHVHVKGSDYTIDTLPEAAAVDEVGANMVFVPLLNSRSTSRLIESIISGATVEQVQQRIGSRERLADV